MNVNRLIIAFPLLLGISGLFSCGDSKQEGVVQYEKSIRTVINYFEEKSMSNPDSVDNIAMESLNYLKAIVPVKSGEAFHQAATDYLSFNLKHTMEFNVKINKISAELENIYDQERSGSVKMSPADSVLRTQKIESCNEKMQQINDTYYPMRDELRKKLIDAQKELGNKNNIEFKDIEFIYEGDSD